VLRACKVAEDAGVPAVAIVATGFMAQAKAIAKLIHATAVPLCEYPGVPALDPDDIFTVKVREKLVPQILQALTAGRDEAEVADEPDAALDPATPAVPAQRDIVFRGSLEAVQNEFERQGWMDGLPVVPPTLEQVDRFLEFTDRPADELLGVVPPQDREATVWNVAVNGVMAGCRPEYMPILIAIAECIADPNFRIQDAGATPGWEPLVIVSGPLTTDLDFNSTVGAMRLGRRANSTLGRFTRMFFRNIAGLVIPPGDTDKGTFGSGMHVALAENDAAVHEMGWPSFREDRGFSAADTVVTVQSCLAVSAPIYSGGNTGLQCMETIVKIMGDVQTPWAFNGLWFDQWHPLVVMSPAVADVFAKDGWTKDDVRRYLYENVKIEAHWFERYPWHIGGGKPFTLAGWVAEGRIGPEYALSDDPGRLIPMMPRAETINVVVAGDPGRNQSKVYVNNHEQGAPTSRRVDLPGNWQELLGRERGRWAGTE